MGAKGDKLRVAEARASEGGRGQAARDMRVINQTRGTIVADNVEVAASFWSRGKGLIGRKGLPAGYGLVIRPCGSIHMFFMSIPLDVLHMDKHGRVLKVLSAIKPWRVGPVVRRGKWVVELPAGTAHATQTQVGDMIILVAQDETDSAA